MKSGNSWNDYAKTRNYWKYLKTRLKKENSEVVSATTQLKLLAPDGKRRLSDMLDYNGIIALGKEFPGKKANRFIEWFTYSASIYACYDSKYFKQWRPEKFAEKRSDRPNRQS